MRTKAEILTAKRDYLAHALDMAQREIDGLKSTSCGLACQCGEMFDTEWEFASHFLIPDEQLLNLGGCPNGDYLKRNTARVTVHFVVATQIGI